MIHFFFYKYNNLIKKHSNKKQLNSNTGFKKSNIQWYTIPVISLIKYVLYCPYNNYLFKTLKNSDKHIIWRPVVAIWHKMWL